MSDEWCDLRGLDPKVVIWDLDGTLWHGTLDAGDSPTPRPSVGLLIELAGRGIVNSICSNNAAGAGLSAIAAVGIDQYVVLPQIDWSNKSDLIADIIDFFGVAPDRVVLVDDDERIRTRVAAQFGIVVVDPGHLEQADLSHWGTEGAGLQRLEQYRVLARRRSAEIDTPRRSSAQAYGVDFLRSCETHLHDVDVALFADRIAELSMRSNRLNLTASRLTADKVRQLGESPVHRCRAVKVSDRFGNYGLCGFVAFNVESNRLDHFFWSCRVLNQGIVEYAAHQLKSRYRYRLTHPALINFGVPVDWISEGPEPLETPSQNEAESSILFVGGCDLDIVAALIAEAGISVSVRGLIEADGIQQYGHSGVALITARKLLDSSDFAATAARLPWIGDVPDVADWSAFDVVVLSLWVVYCCLTVRCDSDVHGVRAPCYKRIDANFSEWEWNHWVGPAWSRSDAASELIFESPLSADELVSGLRTLRSAMTSETRLVLLNAPAIDRPICYEWGERQDIRNLELNSAVVRFAETTENVSVIDVSAIVISAEDLIAPDEPTGFHYRRDAYAQIARELTSGVLRAER